MLNVHDIDEVNSCKISTFSDDMKIDSKVITTRDRTLLSNQDGFICWATNDKCNSTSINAKNYTLE